MNKSSNSLLAPDWY